MTNLRITNHNTILLHTTGTRCPVNNTYFNFIMCVSNAHTFNIRIINKLLFRYRETEDIKKETRNTIKNIWQILDVHIVL